MKGINSLSLKKEKDTLCYVNLEDGENALLKSWLLRVRIIQNKEGRKYSRKKKEHG